RRGRRGATGRARGPEDLRPAEGRRLYGPFLGYGGPRRRGGGARRRLRPRADHPRPVRGREHDARADAAGRGDRRQDGALRDGAAHGAYRAPRLDAPLAAGGAEGNGRADQGGRRRPLRPRHRPRPDRQSHAARRLQGVRRRAPGRGDLEGADPDHGPGDARRAPDGLRRGMEIRPGATAEVALTVTSDRTADVLGNPGVAVLATPFLIGLLEQAAGALIHPHLPPGASTGGTMVEMTH